MLKIKNIEVVYNEVVLVIKGLSIEVQKGEIVHLSVRRDGPKVIDPARALTLGRSVMINS